MGGIGYSSDKQPHDGLTPAMSKRGISGNTTDGGKPMINPALQAKVVDTEDGPTYRVVNDLVTFKAVAADTNGVYSLFEIHTAPGRGMLPLRQRYEDAACWVLEGGYTFLLGKQAVRLDAGDYAFVPRGTVYGYTNNGAAPARMLLLVTPGGIHERFFTDVGERIDDRRGLPTPGGSPDLPQLASIAQKYGIEILPPSATSPHTEGL